jgi:hypothetical protein
MLSERRELPSQEAIKTEKRLNSLEPAS